MFFKVREVGYRKPTQKSIIKNGEDNAPNLLMTKVYPQLCVRAYDARYLRRLQQALIAQKVGILEIPRRKHVALRGSYAA